MLFNFTPMKKNTFKRLRQYLPFILLAISLLACTFAFGDVGNQNRYSSGGGFDGGDGDISGLIYFLIGLFTGDRDSITVAVIVVIVLLYFFIKGKIAKKKGTDPKFVNQQVQSQVQTDTTFDNSAAIAAQIQAIDPAFSSDKFIGFAREVFMKIQEAWTTKDWKPIRPFESETLFNQHKQQLDEYIRLGKTNVVEKIAIKHCSLHSFLQDGDKEVLTVYLNAVMRDYVIDDETKKVLESDPNRDWYMKYEMVFNRKAGVKTEAGKKGNSITNCPNCGAPTEVTSSGQCAYCGSVITNGEHDWVLTDIHSRS